MPILFVVFLSCKYSVLKLFMGVENVGIFFLGILPELKKNALEVLSLTFQTWSCAF